MARLTDYSDEERRAREEAHLTAKLDRKRAIKRSIHIDRTPLTTGAPTGMAAQVPVRVVEEGPHVWYPGTIADIEAVGKRLPAGVMHGVSEIVFRMGAETQEEAVREDPGGEGRDPWTGRLGTETLPGVYMGRILGTYDGGSNRISLFGCVIDPENPPLPPVTALLKLWNLATFAHEVAHHFDHTRRIGRGRWLALGEEKKKVEGFAERCEHEWTQNCVVPYLEENYAEEVAALQHWVEHHGGALIPLGKFVSDPRKDVNWVIHVFAVERALRDLAQDVAAGMPLDKCRLRFATEVHYVGMYEEALAAVKKILDEDPDNDDAMTLRADIWVHQEKYVEASELARAIIARRPGNQYARQQLLFACEGLENWDRVIEIASESFHLSADEHDRMEALYSRCRAHWRSGRTKESDEDLRMLEADGTSSARRVKRLLEERKKRKETD